MSESRPEIIARGMLVEHGRVLVCRNLDQGYAYLPGGHIDPGETADEALAREFMEECGIAITVGHAALVAEVVTGPTDGDLHEYNLVFHVERRGEGPIESLEPGIGFEWLDLAGVVDADLRPVSIKAWLASGGEASGPAVSFVSSH